EMPRSRSGIDAMACNHQLVLTVRGDDEPIHWRIVRPIEKHNGSQNVRVIIETYELLLRIELAQREMHVVGSTQAFAQGLDAINLTFLGSEEKPVASPPLGETAGDLARQSNQLGGGRAVVQLIT